MWVHCGVAFRVPQEVSVSTTIARPTPAQLHYQREHAFGLFFHLGINTFHGKEWSDGTLDPAGFDPSALDCRQWVETAKEAGAAHVILTAKHHDGFCLWQTGTTDYSVASSPWKHGQGDVVAELAAACAELGVELGLYLSPWDRHEPNWATDHAAYDAFYLRQLEELTTRYGPLCELWFDGAGSERHPYDWDAIMDTCERNQPDAMIFNMGRPTIRWVGNEDGLASDPVWYTVTDTATSIYTDAREGLAGGGWYLPPECDVSIRRGWFWHPSEEHTLKSVEHLAAIWYRSIGLGANLLLNVPPDRRGLIDDADRDRLLAFTGRVHDRFAHPMVASPARDARGWAASWPEPVALDHIVLEEDVSAGQRIGRHRVVDAATGRVLAEGGTIGVRRVHAFPQTTTSGIIIETDTGDAMLSRVDAHLTGVESAPALEEQPPFPGERVDRADHVG
jgi:alpha-L-fucosidase